MASLKRFTVLNRSLRSKAPAQYSIGALVSGNNKITKIVDNPFPLNPVTPTRKTTSYGLGGNPFVGKNVTPGLQAEVSVQIISQPFAEVSMQVIKTQPFGYVYGPKLIKRGK
jgi:hypothetical protein